MGKFKRSLKKTNRGLVLALVLIVAVVVYTIIDNNNFKSEKPVISGVVEEYVNGFKDFMFFDEAHTSLSEEKKGRPFSENEKKELTKKWSEYVDKYWEYKDYSNNYYFYGVDNSDVKRLYEDFINQAPESYITSFSAKTKNIVVKKAGPECATAEVEMNFIVEGTSGASFLSPSYLELANYKAEYSDSELRYKTSKSSITGTYTFNLQRFNGKWKIVGIYGYTDDMEEIHDKEGGEE